MNSYPLAKHFEDVSAKIKVHGASAKQEEQLNFYGLFKQATVGDVNIDKPSFYQLEAKAKFNAWEKVKGKSQEQAKHEYVEAALTYFPEEEKAKYQA